MLDDDDGLGGMVEELGLGGVGLKGLMKNFKVWEGLIGDGGDVLGGEVFGIICEREVIMSGDFMVFILYLFFLLYVL